MGSQTEATGHIFISYAREDQTYARSLAGDLRKRSLEPWIDDRIDFGDRWWRTIVEAIHTCAAFIVVMTPDSESSEWVELEIMLALDEDKLIFPLLLSGKVNTLLGNRQYDDVTGGQMPSDKFYERLARVVRPPVMQRRQSFEPEMVLIPAGKFLMGSDPRKDQTALADEQPQHDLYLPDYYIAKTPVANAQYTLFLEATVREPPGYWKARKPPPGKGSHPVVDVSWYDAVSYCRWLTTITGKPYRLPSEAEWEKGARGTGGWVYPWGDDPPDESRCNFGLNVRDTTPIGQYSRRGDNPYGLVDMAGNVWEWTRSLWGTDGLMPDFKYPYDLADGREELEAGDKVLRVVRGGAFYCFGWEVRCAVRGKDFPYLHNKSIGFRVVVSPL